MDENLTFTVINDEGQETECEILFTFENTETEKHYVVYTDNSLDENGDVCIFASVYDPDAEEPTLLPIETEAEWDVIDEILAGLQDGEDGNE